MLLDPRLLEAPERAALRQWLRRYRETLAQARPNKSVAIDGFDVAGIVSLGTGVVAAAYAIDAVVGMGVISVGMLGARWLRLRRAGRTDALIAAITSAIEDIRDTL